MNVKMANVGFEKNGAGAVSAEETARFLHELDAEVDGAYPHHSALYRFLASEAPLKDIVSFLCWDAVQPAYSVFLRRWLEKVPASVRPLLVEHIAEEEDQQHSQLYQSMMRDLVALCPVKVDLDHARLEVLNYTFSDACAQEQPPGFFAGAFFATEKMAQKRCKQVLDGLMRVGVKGETLKFMEIHGLVDGAHADEVLRGIIAPMIREDRSCLETVRTGMRDRLSRSENYLRWYERHVLQF